MTREELLQIAKPILFNTDMVLAILDDRKTDTRHIMKPQPILQNGLWMIGFAGWSDRITSIHVMPGHSLYKRAPYKSGDYLYVRETYSFWPCWDCDIDCNECCSSWNNTDGCFVYRTQKNRVPYDGKWRPSIHMPKEAARIFLRVNDVRVERLQDMDTPNDEHFLAEGAKDKHDFIRIWDSTLNLVGRDMYCWYGNPWVWVIEFERIHPD